MTEVAIHQGQALAPIAPTPNAAVAALMDWAQSAQAAHGVATHLVRTSFVPEGFRGKPDEATAAILAGIEVGLQPMAALRSCDVIQGTAAFRAQALRAIVQSQGHEVWLVESTETRAIVAGRRRGASQEQRSVWTIDRAQKAGLTGKANWRNQPQAMLVARATSELCRLIASDAILGLGYSAEEVADGFEADVVPLASASPKRRTARRATSTTATTVERADAPPAPTQEFDEPPFDEDGPQTDTGTSTSRPTDESEGGDLPEAVPVSDRTKPTRLQNNNMYRMFGDLGLTDRDDRLAKTSEILGRVVTTSTGLTREEASRLIDALALELGEIPPAGDES